MTEYEKNLKIFTPASGGAFIELAGIVDDYSRLYHTVSFTDAGILELDAADTPRLRRLLSVGNAVNIGENLYFIDKTDVSGGILTVSGHDSLYLFDRRVYPYRVRQSVNVATFLCTLATFGSSALPGSFATAGSGSGEVVYLDHEYNSLYRLMRDICRQNACGMKLVYEPSTLTFTFHALRRTDMSASQSELPRVIVSRERENVLSERLTDDAGDFYNSALVYGCEDMNGGRYTVTVGEPLSDRRELFVDASYLQLARYAVTSGGYVDYDENAYLAKLAGLGRDALDSHRRTRSFEAELAPGVDVKCGSVLTYISGDIQADAVVSDTATEIRAGRVVKTVKIRGEY